MTGIIYKITNSINDKVYIGQTRMSLPARWSKHKQIAQKSNKGLYGAMQKYGIENFKIEEIIRCEIEKLNELEVFYIKKYNSFYNGYNLTIGGDNAPTNGLVLNEKEVIKKYIELKYITDTAKFFKCCEKTIKNIFDKHNIKIEYIPKNIDLIKNYHCDNSKKIKIVELNKEFDSLINCAQWLINNNYSKTSNPRYAQKSISRVLNGDRKTYCKFHFKFI